MAPTPGGPVLMMLVFSPSTPLMASTDYSVYYSVSPDISTGCLVQELGSSGGSCKIVFSTASRPSISQVRFISKDAGQTFVYATVRYSELVPSADVGSGVAFAVGDSSVAGSFEPTAATSTDYRFDFATPVSASADLSVTATAAAGSKLAAEAHKISPAQLLPCATDEFCWVYFPLLAGTQ